jgi:hypothetical protein
LAASRIYRYELKVKTICKKGKKSENPQTKNPPRGRDRAHSWLNRFRNLLVGFEKTETSYNALPDLAAAMICWRKTVSIYR